MLVSHCICFIVTDALAKSIRSRTSIHFGLYFSLFEWFHPLYLSDKEAKFTTRDYVEVRYYSLLLFRNQEDWGANNKFTLLSNFNQYRLAQSH